MSGFGTMPFGTQPFGLGTPATAGSNAGALLPDVYGVTQGSRYIDSSIRQYTYGANGNSAGMSNTAQLVLMAVLTVAGSSAQTSLGLENPSGVIGPNFVSQQQTKITNALAALVAAKTIAVTAIDVNVTNRPVSTVVRWVDLTTSQEQETAV